MKKYMSTLAGASLLATLTGAVTLGNITEVSASANNTIQWAGCGITKKAFMKELATAFEKKTHVKVVLNGGGATKGIRQTAALKVDMGGSCRMTLPEVERKELHVSLHPVAWDALAVIVNPENPV